MRIAQIAPLHESVPPVTYGGTERFVSWLTEELVARGHDVTLFATGDSVTSAKLHAIAPRGLRHETNFLMDKVGFQFLAFEKVLKMADDFDIIHFHTDYWHLTYSRLMKTPSVTTFHSRLDYPPLISIFDQFSDFSAIAISNSQRSRAPQLNWEATIYHGLPVNQYFLNENPGDYVLFLGRLCQEKRPDRAIEIAKKAKISLKIAAKVDPADTHYFHEVIEPMLKTEGVEYIGEVTDEQKQNLIGGAKALIHPVEFPEPFGLVLIEAMACGTPTVAFRSGSIPEVIDEGITGFIVDDIDPAVEALKKIDTLNRKQIRTTFENRFTASVMVDQYLKIYELLIARRQLEHLVPTNSTSTAKSNLLY